MKWQLAESTSKQDIYELWQGSAKLLTLDFHTSTNAARIQYASEKRVFMIRKEGFLRNKTVLCNEYGIRLGQMVHENKENYIELNNERYSYKIQHNPFSELIIYRESKKKPLVVCRLDINREDSSLYSNRKSVLPVNVYSSLLLALCWYIHLPVVQEKTLAFAV